MHISPAPSSPKLSTHKELTSKNASWKGFPSNNLHSQGGRDWERHPSELSPSMNGRKQAWGSGKGKGFCLDVLSPLCYWGNAISRSNYSIERFWRGISLFFLFTESRSQHPTSYLNKIKTIYDCGHPSVFQLRRLLVAWTEVVPHNT